jgi:hypothetical protein
MASKVSSPRQFLGHQHWRQRTNAESIAQQPGDRRHRVHAVQARRQHAVGLHQRQHFLVRMGVFRVGDDPFPRQIGDAVLAVVDRVAGDDPAQRMAGQLQAADAFVAQQIGLQDHVEKAFLQLIAEVQRGIGHQLDFHPRIAIGHLRHQRAEPGVDHRVHHADAHPPDLARTGLDRLLQRLHGVEHLLGIIQHLQAFGRQADAA